MSRVGLHEPDGVDLCCAVWRLAALPLMLPLMLLVMAAAPDPPRPLPIPPIPPAAPAAEPAPIPDRDAAAPPAQQDAGPKIVPRLVRVPTYHSDFDPSLGYVSGSHVTEDQSDRKLTPSPGFSLQIPFR